MGNGVITNEFATSRIDSRVRPYLSRTIEHKDSLATILVYTKKEEKTESKPVNYLSNFESKIESLNNYVIKKDVAVGSLEDGSIEDPSGKIHVEKLDGENDYYGVFNNFSLLNIQESSEQIVKLHVNFGADWNAFFFGDKPKVYTFSGFFLDTMDYPYYQEFMVAYEKYLSGRKSIEKQVQIKIIYDGKIVDGYILNISTGQTAMDQQTKTFQFSVLVKGMSWARTNLIPKGSIPGLGSGYLKESFNGLSNFHRLDNFLYNESQSAGGRTDSGDIRVS